MGSITNLLLLYSGILLLNTLISGLLWVKLKLNLYRLLFFVWLAIAASFLIQGMFQDPPLWVIYSFSSCTIIGYAFIALYKEIEPIPAPWRVFIIAQVLGVLGTTALYYVTPEFSIYAFPLALTTALPYIYLPYYVFKKKYSLLSFTHKGFLITSLISGLHILDFPFVRYSVAGFSVGFTIAFLEAVGVSIFAFGVVLESITQEKVKVEAEVNVAHKIQMEILPKETKLPNLNLLAYMKSADEVGGDYYDIHSAGDQSWIFVGDVTGHGLGSGLVMFMAQSIIQSILHTQPDIRPGQLNFLANQVLCSNLGRLQEQRPMTIATLRFDDEKNFTLSGCHDNIYIYRHQSKTVDIIRVDHFPIGIGFEKDLDHSFFSESKYSLEKEDLLFIGTDGITEAENPKTKEQYTEVRLIQFIKDHAESPLKDIQERLTQDLDEFTNKHYYDDVTFILARAK